MGQKDRHALGVMKAISLIEGMPLLGQTGVQGNVEEGSLNYRFYQLVEFTTEHEM